MTCSVFPYSSKTIRTLKPSLRVQLLKNEHAYVCSLKGKALLRKVLLRSFFLCPAFSRRLSENLMSPRSIPSATLPSARRADGSKDFPFSYLFNNLPLHKSMKMVKFRSGSE